MKAKKKNNMGLNKTEKKGRKKVMKNKMKKTNLSTVINIAAKTLKKQKTLYIMGAIKVAHKSIHQSMGSKINVKVLHYFDSFGNLQPPREVVKILGI